jgi:tyrosinase
MWCVHGRSLFLPRHRAYLYYFEQYLADQDPAAALPWWDWTTQSGISDADAAAMLTDSAANPLAAGPVTDIPQAPQQVACR